MMASPSPTYEELIARLEKASGPDRELDAEIHRLCVGEVWSAPLSGHWLPDGTAPIPSYTASLDAATTLLPWHNHPGATFTIKIIQSGRGEFYCYAEFTWPSTENQGRGRTPPLATAVCAICAIRRTEQEMAPYKARALKEREGM